MNLVWVMKRFTRIWNAKIKLCIPKMGFCICSTEIGESNMDPKDYRYVHSVENSEFFFHSYFTWNDCWQSFKIKRTNLSLVWSLVGVLISRNFGERNWKQNVANISKIQAIFLVNQIKDCQNYYFVHSRDTNLSLSKFHNLPNCEKLQICNSEKAKLQFWPFLHGQNDIFGQNLVLVPLNPDLKPFLSNQN